MIRLQYSRLAGARAPTVATRVAVVAARLKAGAVPATPMMTDSPSPSAPASSVAGEFRSMVKLPVPPAAGGGLPTAPCASPWGGHASGNYTACLRDFNRFRGSRALPQLPGQPVDHGPEPGGAAKLLRISQPDLPYHLRHLAHQREPGIVPRQVVRQQAD